VLSDTTAPLRETISERTAPLLHSLGEYLAPVSDTLNAIKKDIETELSAPIECVLRDVCEFVFRVHVCLFTRRSCRQTWHKRATRSRTETGQRSHQAVGGKQTAERHDAAAQQVAAESRSHSGINVDGIDAIDDDKRVGGRTVAQWWRSQRATSCGVARQAARRHRR
jgi:hypothetical protein